MFSIKIITIVQIFSELESFYNRNEGGSCRKVVCSLKNITDTCSAPNFVVKSVLITMLRSKWLDKNHRGYFLIVDPQSISLFDMYKELHEGIAIGESMGGSYANNLYRHIEKWHKMAKVEDDILRDLTSKFKDIKLNDMVVAIESN